MSVEIKVLKELVFGPNKDDPADRVYKVVITNPTVLYLLRYAKKNRQNETIQKLADMEGNDPTVHISTYGIQPQEFVDLLTEDPKMMQAILVASRGKEVEECGHCKQHEEGENRLFDRCYKVPGMEDMGCCLCVAMDQKCSK